MGLRYSISDQSRVHRHSHHKVTFPRLQPLFCPTQLRNTSFLKAFQGFCTQKRRWLTYFPSPFLLVIRQIILMHRNLPVSPSCTSRTRHGSSWAASPSTRAHGARPHPQSCTRTNQSIANTSPRTRLHTAPGTLGSPAAAAPQKSQSQHRSDTERVSLLHSS